MRDTVYAPPSMRRGTKFGTDQQFYKIIGSSLILDKLPEDEVYWMSLSPIALDQLTPFAKFILKQTMDDKDEN